MVVGSTWPVPPPDAKPVAMVALGCLLRPLPMPRVVVSRGEPFLAPADRVANFLVLGLAKMDGGPPPWWPEDWPLRARRGRVVADNPTAYR